MKEIKNDIIKIFQVDDYDYNNYIVYIKDFNDCYECYLQNKNYGIIALMFGLPKKQNSLNETIIICNNNIEEEIKTYQDLYED